MKKHIRALVLGATFLVLVGFLIWVYSAIFASYARAPRPAAPVTQADLQLEYTGMNDVYFDGKLPRDTQIEYLPDGRTDIGRTFINDKGGFTIFINAYYDRSRREALFTEYHESCHIATWRKDFDPHGPAFQLCMRRLAEAGAFKDLW